MKVKKIIDICRASGTLLTFDTGADREEWVGDGSALYPLTGVPRCDAKTLCKMYDIDDKKARDMRLGDVMELPRAYDFRDNAHGAEHEADRGSVELILRGERFVPFFGHVGEVVYINRVYLVPIQDESKREIRYFLRRTEEGTLYLAVKLGMLLTALILPNPEAGASAQNVMDIMRIAKDWQKQHSVDPEKTDQIGMEGLER